MYKRVQIWVNECECEKCGFKWTTYKVGLPTVCGKCKNPKWNSQIENPTMGIDASVLKTVHSESQYNLNQVEQETKEQVIDTENYEPA